MYLGVGKKPFFHKLTVCSPSLKISGALSKFSAWLYFTLFAIIKPLNQCLLEFSSLPPPPIVERVVFLVNGDIVWLILKQVDGFDISLVPTQLFLFHTLNTFIIHTAGYCIPPP